MPRKRCAACKAEKQWDDFYAKTRWPDGSVRQPQSRCKACYPTPSRATQRRASRRYWERVKADPERHAQVKERWREWYRQTHDSTPERWLVKEAELRLDARPFAVWLCELVSRHGNAAVVKLTGLEESYLRKLVKGEFQTVSLSVVDEATIRTPTGLWELYPEMAAA